MSQYVAWDGNTYEGKPPRGWVRARDGRWWPIESVPRQTQASRPPPPPADPPPPGPIGSPGWHSQHPEPQPPGNPKAKGNALVKLAVLVALAVLAVIGIAGAYQKDPSSSETQASGARFPTGGRFQSEADFLADDRVMLGLVIGGALLQQSVADQKMLCGDKQALVDEIYYERGSFDNFNQPRSEIVDVVNGSCALAAVDW